MNPDLFLTIAFVLYAVAGAATAGLRAARSRRGSVEIRPSPDGDVAAYRPISAIRPVSDDMRESEMTTPATVDESLIAAEGYELLSAELERLPSDGRRQLSELAVWRQRQSVDEVTFYGLVLLRNEGLVMTPRATSERLVFETLCRLNGRGRCRIADVGTGSGAIAIAVASACPEVEVWATDANPAAVGLARANVRLHGLAARVFVEQGDLLAPVPAPLDLIVANLPYVPEAAAADHPDLWIEPADAVFAAGDGLGPYRRLVDDAADWLAADGALLLQLDRRILVAGRNDLAALRAGIDDLPPAVDAFISQAA